MDEDTIRRMFNNGKVVTKNGKVKKDSRLLCSGTDCTVRQEPNWLVDRGMVHINCKATPRGRWR